MNGNTLQFGIGLNDRDRSLVEELFSNNKIQVLVCTSTLAWGVNLPAHLVIIKGTEYYDGKTKRYVDYDITYILQMMGRAACLNIFEYRMSGKPSDDTTGQVRPEGDISDEKVETANQNEGDGMPSPHEEEAAIKKKYGGIVPRKPPLISKDHERAYFDSADWALGKQGGNPQKPVGPLEALRPKLHPTQQQAGSRRFPYASADNEEGINSPTEGSSPNQDSTEGKDKDKE